MEANKGSLSKLSFSRTVKLFIQGSIVGLCLLALSFAQWTPSIQGSEDVITEKVDTSQGLRGILPAEVPADLNVEEFEVLNGKWQTWGEEMAALVTKLYEDESLKAEGQTKLIGQLNDRLKTMENSILDRRYHQIHAVLITLHGRVSRRVALAEAALATMDLDASTEKKKQIANARAGVVKAANHLDKSLRRIENGSPWFDYVRGDELRKLASEGKNATALVADIEKKFAGKSTLSKDQQNFFSREMFVYFIQEAKKLSAAENMKVDNSNGAAIRAELGNLVSGLEQFEATNLLAAAAKARAAFDKIRDLSPDAGETISSVLRTHYFNYNVRIVVSEKFANKLIHEKRKEKRAVNDNILSAHVTGSSVTTATAGIDFRANNEGIRFDLTVNGVVNTDTQGVTDKATIYSRGHHRFWAKKQIFFNGKQFYYDRPAKISIDANLRTIGASTSYSSVPIFGGIADGIAVRKAGQKRGESEAIARGKISDEVLPEMEKEAKSEFSRFNKSLKEDWVEGLKEAGLAPSAEQLYSTKHLVVMNRRLMNFGELGGGDSVQPINPGNGIAIRIHESMFNNAIDKMDLAGKTMTEADFKKEFENALSDVLGRDITFSEPEKQAKKDAGPDTFVLDKTDPIRIDIDNGELRVTLRTGFKQAGKEDIPAQIVTIPIKIEIVEGELVFSRVSAVSISPVAPPARRALQIARAGIIRKKVQSSMPVRKRTNTINVKRGDKKPVDLQISKIEALNGWLTIWVE